MLEKFLKKLGVNSYLDLNDEEKATYMEWEKSLSGRKITDKEVQDFLAFELDQAVTRVTEVNLSEKDEMFRKVEIRFIKKLQSFINSPLVEKQFAEKAIEQLTK